VSLESEIRDMIRAVVREEIRAALDELKPARPASAPAADEYVDEREFHRRIDVAVKTIQDWRAKNTGPAWIKMGRNVRYPMSGVRAWLETQRRR
jgi:predicted DNA-binding transcriptional regulator AlpA